MRSEQLTIVMGALSGVTLMTLLVYTLAHIGIAPIPEMDQIENRIAFAILANIFAIFPFFIMVVTIGNRRFLSSAIDPLQHMESKSLEIDARVAENTLQQNFIFFVATLGLSVVLTPLEMPIIASLTAVYILSRFIFWIGYRLNPLYRAPGMAATGYMNLGIILFIIWRLFS